MKACLLTLTPSSSSSMFRSVRVKPVTSESFEVRLTPSSSWYLRPSQTFLSLWQLTIQTSAPSQACNYNHCKFWSGREDNFAHFFAETATTEGFRSIIDHTGSTYIYIINILWCALWSSRPEHMLITIEDLLYKTWLKDIVQCSPDTSGILKWWVAFLHNNLPLPGSPVSTFVQLILLQRFNNHDRKFLSENHLPSKCWLF